MRLRSAALVTLGLATAMHLDWHFARPAHHRLSLGLSWHWLLAVPVCALTGWYAARTWPKGAWRPSLAIFAGAGIIAGIVEPAYEYWIDGASWDWAFGDERVRALLLFMAVGFATHATVRQLLRSRMTAPPTSRA